MKKFYILGVLIISSTSIAFDKSSCKQAGEERSVELKSSSDKKAPCKVLYHKDSKIKAAPMELWKAENDYGYCEEKAKSLVDKLRTMGWQCD